jgi:hypothetical protein
MGLCFGWLFKYILTHSRNAFWGLIFIVPLYDTSLNIFGMNVNKIMGGTAIYFISFLIINKFILPFIEVNVLRKNKE